ncbi:response regulator [Roseomonas fluvialis]|uniref:Response regulator n=1 Tax=Roseomonas fluvialis TaxID=1750527 RepID=A0ABN6P506_9PROT|nr:response regulator [Roseomonas fluvialis]BDG73410.1 response regulator [Roseomonas fluvialis]
MSSPATERRILVVEDEALVAMLVEDALMDAGFTVVGPARTVSQALELLKADPPDAAVLDLNLGGENSLSVADALSARGIPFLVATGYGAAGLPAHLRHIPVLPKPYDPADLTVAIDRLCAGAR